MSKKITENELVDRFNKLYEKLRRIPNRDEMGHREPIKRLYGNYNNFIRKLGHLPNQLRTKKDYIKYIQGLFKKLKAVPSINDLENEGVYRLSIYQMFGSYNNLLKESGLKTIEMAHTDKTEDELLLDYINISNGLGRWATTGEVKKELGSIDIYENRFGSIIDVRKLVVNDSRLKITDKQIKKPNNRKYTDENIDELIKRAIAKYDNNIKKKELVGFLKQEGGPSINTVMKRKKYTSFRSMIEQEQHLKNRE